MTLGRLPITEEEKSFRTRRRKIVQNQFICNLLEAEVSAQGITIGSQINRFES